MILLKEYVFLTTAAMKMGKRIFYSDHSNGGFLEEKMLHWDAIQGMSPLPHGFFRNFYHW